MKSLLENPHVPKFNLKSVIQNATSTSETEIYNEMFSEFLKR